MKINRALNLVLEVESDVHGTVRVHSTPISREVFEQYFMVISKTFANLFSQGLGVVAGPRVAYLMLRQVATDLGTWEDVNRGLVSEIVRLSNVGIAGDKGWKSQPLQVLIDSKAFDEEALADVMGQLVFFTCVVRMHKLEAASQFMEAAGGLWGSGVTSLPLMEFLNTLPTLTEPESSGETASTLSVPT